jgi:putative photosynthetic complex assembly protein
MSDPFRDRPIHPAPLLGAAALIVLTIVLVVGARSSGIGAAKVTLAPEAIARDLRFEDRPDGSVAVIDAHSGEQVDSLAPGQDNFIRGALRSLVRDGKQVSASAGRAFRLSVRTDGRFVLEDTQTGRLINLEAFGATNAGAFARLLHAQRTAMAAQHAPSRN